MNWATTMAGNADDDADNRAPSDDSGQRSVVPGAWDPHQVWLTRVKQPRDARPCPSSPAPAKSTSARASARIRARATR